MYVIRFTALTSSCTRDDARSTSRAKPRAWQPATIDRTAAPSLSFESTRANSSSVATFTAVSARTAAPRSSMPRRASQSAIVSSRSARSSGETPVGRVWRQFPRARSTAASSDSLSCASPSTRAASSASAIASPNNFAPRVAADAGLFSSCARPAATRPNEATFSPSRSFSLNVRARSTIACTSAAVTCGHDAGIWSMSSRSMHRNSVRSLTAEPPEATVIRE